MTITRVKEMFRLYVGNVDSRVTEETIQNLVEEQGISVDSIVLKRGYAFIDCPDQKTFEEAINKLNGYNLMGSALQVESSSISRRMRTNRVQIMNLPPMTNVDEIQQLLSNYGTVDNCELLSSETETIAVVTFDTMENARSVVDELNDYSYEGLVLQVEFVFDTNGQHELPSQMGPSQRNLDTPLRILVPSDFVGAIIGRKGQTIRNITATWKVRVDVHGKESTCQLEKIISIYGHCDQCTEACKEIMNIMQKESTNANGGDITLKMLIDDRFCGRIIGREGKTIKKVREDTETKITISNVQEMVSIYPDRIIAIRGSVDSMSRAENAISTKLIECHERDMYSFTRPPMPSSLPVSPSGGVAGAFSSAAAVRPMYSHEGGQGYYASSSHGPAVTSPASRPSPTIETCHISIPNFAVGAVIGAGGTNIKRIIRDSNAFVTVEPRQEVLNPVDERVATIKGNADACWRASYFIFEKMKLEGFAGSDGEVRLRTTITVPRSAAGRVIGKGGKNVREIQRITGAMIKLPVDVSHDPQHQQQPLSDDVTVEVFGNFIATQSAHNRIRSMVSKLSQPPGATTSSP